MKCLVFSDSHGSAYFMERAIAMHPDAKIVFFLGDGIDDLSDIFNRYPGKSFLAVRGNCDRSIVALGRPIPKTDRIEILGKRIVYTHGDLAGVKFGIDGLILLAAETEADIILFGHTHSPVSAYIPCDESNASAPKKPFYIFNPGSIGMLGSPTFGILTLTEGEPLFSHGKF